MASPDHDKLHIVPRLLFFEFLLLVRKERSSHDQHRMLHIGKRIKEVFDAQPKSHNIEWFAAQLNCKRANIYNIFNRAVIDTQLLYQISEVLDHDFFKDFSDDLLRSKGEKLNEKQQIYDEMMKTLGRTLSRQLKRVNVAGSNPGFQINKWDKEDSKLPPSKYIVSVKAGEDSDIVPHIHIYSIEEHFDLRFGICENNFRLLPVLNYGSREPGDDFSDILPDIEYWTKNGKSAAVLYAFENYKFALQIYNTVNPSPLARNVFYDPSWGQV